MELQAFKKSIDIYFQSRMSNNTSNRNLTLRSQADTVSMNNNATNYQNNDNIEPPPSFLRAAL
jgi:K+-sensing histidine kinase KdpD